MIHFLHSTVNFVFYQIFNIGDIVAVNSYYQDDIFKDTNIESDSTSIFFTAEIIGNDERSEIITKEGHHPYVYEYRLSAGNVEFSTHRSNVYFNPYPINDTGKPNFKEFTHAKNSKMLRKFWISCRLQEYTRTSFA